MTSFPTPSPVRARIELELGDIHAVAHAGDETVVDVVPTDPSSEKDRRTAEQTRVTCTDGRLDVIGPKRSALVGPTRKSGSVQVTVRVPEGSALEAHTSLGVITADGRFDEVGVLLDRLRSAGARIEDMEVGKPDLEDVFVDVMRAA